MSIGGNSTTLLKTGAEIQGTPQLMPSAHNIDLSIPCYKKALDHNIVVVVLDGQKIISGNCKGM